MICLRLLLLAALVTCGGCASGNKDGLTTLDVSERHSGNYGTSDANTEKDANANNIDFLKYKKSF